MPDAPTWAEHVKPIVDAHCVRCHGSPPIGGAPAGFRLDAYADSAGLDGEQITEGAGTMAEAMAARVGAGFYELDDHQRATILIWAALAGPFDGSAPAARAPRGLRIDNGPPTLTLTERERAGSVITFDYQVSDPDLETITGEIRAGATLGASRIIPAAVHDGRGSFAFDTAGRAAGDTHLFAILDDGSPPQIADLGAVRIEHPDDDVPPRVTLFTPAPFSILSDRDDAEIVFETVDPDATAPLRADLRAYSDDDDIVVIASDVAVTAGSITTIAWDTRALAAGDWFVEVTVSDGTATRTARSNRLLISHATTDESYGSLSGLLAERCAGCHQPGALFDLPVDLGRYRIRAAGEPPGVYDVRAQVYRRVILERTMPPATAPARLGAAQSLSTEERARLGEWLLAGAPE